jgi:hypothetical protein
MGKADVDGSGARMTDTLSEGAAPSVPAPSYPAPGDRLADEPTTVNGQGAYRARAAVSVVPPVVPREVYETDPYQMVVTDPGDTGQIGIG